MFQYSKSAQTCKFKFSAFPRSNIIQTLHEASVGHGQQLSQLAKLQIPKIFHVINFGTDSNLNLP
jgi:hypothetical protein